MHILASLLQQRTSHDHHTCGAIAYLMVLRDAKVKNEEVHSPDTVLRGWMGA